MEKKGRGRTVNRYFITIPVSGWRIAGLFGSETNWDILNALRDAGLPGLTVGELSQKTDTSKSTLYGVLRELEAGNYVKSTKRRLDWGRPRREAQLASGEHGRKHPRVFMENVPWGYAELDDEFATSLEPLLEKHKGKLQKLWLAFLDNVVTKYKNDEKLEAFFPKDPIHEECKWSHEAHEFLRAISIAMLQEILDQDQDKFAEFAQKHGFAKV